MYNSFRSLIFTCLLLTFSSFVISQEDTTRQIKPTLTHQMTPEEYQRRHEIGLQFILTDPPAGEITSIAEFDRAVGTVVAYPLGIPVSLVREMAKDAIVTTLVRNASAENSARNLYTQARVNLDNCQFLQIATDSYWTRDFGPMYITYGDNQIGIVDFPYNRPRPLDDDAPRTLAQQLGIEWFGMPVVHTGGNYMTDGYGFASSTMIAYTENPSLIPAQVDQHMMNYLGINDYSVLEDPNNTYIDHIDCWGKYLAPDKVLIRSVPVTHPQYNDIEATAAYFANKISIYGVPYRVYRVNTPQNQPYTNSYILNDKVFVPIMNSSHDEAALQVYRDAMPGYKVFGVIGASGTPWESTDALHCRTHEMADLGMLYIKHMATVGNTPIQSDYTFNANITPYSGQPILVDSARLYYRVNANPSTPFASVSMSHTSGSNYTASLSDLQPGSKIEYYIFAADASGRREFHPFIGQPDPHVFYVGNPLFANVAVNPPAMEFTIMKDLPDSLPLAINNTGQLELNYSISISTDVNDTLVYNLTNSPAANAYSSNTLTETGWTTIVIDQEGQVNNLLVNYQWDTDDYYTEGSLWIESPSGTTFRVGAAQTDGTYLVACPVFANESISGNWKVWIEDSYGDGGHRALNASIKIVKLNPSGNWLSTSSISGTIAAGSSADLQVLINTQGLELGSYEGSISILSNDPDQPIVKIPVNLEVTINISSKPHELYTKQIEVNPNPFTNELSVMLNLSKESNTTFDLYNSTGIMVYSANQNIASGLQTIKIPANNIPAGVYMLKVTHGTENKTFKLIKR